MNYRYLQIGGNGQNVILVSVFKGFDLELGDAGLNQYAKILKFVFISSMMLITHISMISLTQVG